MRGGDDSRRRFPKHLSVENLLPFSKSLSRSTVVVFFAVAVFVAVFLSRRLLIFSLQAAVGNSGTKSTTDTWKWKSDNYHQVRVQGPRRHVESSVTGTTFNSTKTKQDPDGPGAATCPEYFRWILEDLRPWAERRITKAMLEEAQKKAHFRLVIVDGKAYVEAYEKAYQSRDILTVWGVVQLLRRYPGKVPDLDLMFNCDDRPEIYRKDYRGSKFNDPSAPPPLFRYSGDDATLDIVFPDWSFWGWPEINIKPWEAMLEDIKAGNERMKWTKREPYAYWKGNPVVAYTRRDLLRCNVTRKQDWNARLYRQDWTKTSFKDSNLANQCVHRFKIYIEGKAWSVSQKYILACDSVTLIVRPRYYDFFTRSLIPMQHYWPISPNRKCPSIKFAVQWGNTHNEKAMAIGEAGSKFIQEELRMEYIYDYMYHLLNEYSKLLTFKPTVPANAMEFSSESMASAAQGSIRNSMTESSVKSPADSGPCAMQPPYDPQSLELLLRTNENSIEQVENWERSFWESGQTVEE